MDELFELGLVRLLIQRDMNHRLGVNPKSDDLPDLFFDKPIKSSGAKLDGAVINRAEFIEMKSAVIKRLQWSESGGVDQASKIWQECERSIVAVRSRIL
jgi:aldehyde:ferredoxin oxidoreductase